MLFIKESLELKDFILSYYQESKKDHQIEKDFQNIIIPTSLKSEISQYVSEKEIKKDSIPELKRIKEEIYKINQNIVDECKRILKKDKKQYELEEPTMQEGRMVLLLKSSEKNYQEQGFFLGSSNTGASVYFEPYEINKLNNSLVQKTSEYKRALYEILKKLSNRIEEEKEKIKQLYSFIIKFDKIYSRALFAKNYNLNRAQITDTIDLINAKNPLIERNCIPINFCLKDKSLIVLSGVNAGGKTVTLKTIAISALMMKSGFFIPSAQGSKMILFDKVFIEIEGDQSIQSSLSSFTSHLKNLNQIIKNASKNSLILIDEICSSTSPNEGSALAKAIFDHLIESNIKSIITTHYENLKHYGFTKEKVENASVLFDTEKNKALYKIKMGMSSSSYALKIANNVNFDKNIVQNAYRYVEKDRESIEKITNDLVEKQKEINLILEKNKKIKEEIEKIHKKLKEEKLKLKEEEVNFKSEILKDYKEKFEKEIKEEKTRKRLKEEEQNIKEIYKNIEKEKEAKLKEIKIKIGDNVLIKSNKKKGNIIKINKYNTYSVQVGLLQIELKKYEFEKIEEEPNKIEKIYKANYNLELKINLDIRGLTLEEGLKELERNIEVAYVKNAKSFSVIHGKGNGVLQRGVHQFLKKENNVEEFFFALQEDGGWGKTNIILKSRK